MREIEFAVRGDHITLDALLKATGLAPSGGGAKTLVATGKVQVDGQMEMQRGRKLRAGQVAAVAGTRVRLTAALESSAENSAENTEPQN
jgi:ribosome-associated protein